MPWFPDFAGAAELVRRQTRAAGEVRGHHQLRRFVRRNQEWLAERHVRIETVAATVAGPRAVVELLAHLGGDGPELAWPVAVVAESADDRSVVFRSYCSQWPIAGRILP